MRSVVLAVLGAALAAAAALAYPGFTVRVEWSVSGSTLELGHYSLTSVQFEPGLTLLSEVFFGKADFTLGSWWYAGFGAGVTPGVNVYVGGGLRLWALVADNYALADLTFAPYLQVIYIWRDLFTLGVRLVYPPKLDLSAPLGGPLIALLAGIAW